MSRCLGILIFPGVVARYPSLSETGITINNVGEGANWRQAYDPLAWVIKNVWQDQTQGIIDRLNGAGQNLINFNSSPSMSRAKCKKKMPELRILNQAKISYAGMCVVQLEFFFDG